MSLEIRRFASRDALTEALVERLAAAAEGARASAVPVALMLAGGSTPMPAYRELAGRILAGRAQAGNAPAPQLRVLYSDDRHVPSSDEASNYHQTEPLLTALALPEAHVLRVRTELPLAEAALDYDGQLAALLTSGARLPLGLLGIGADGHTASLFRPEHLAQARGKLAIAVQRPDGRGGVSATPAFLARVEELLFVVAGGGKHDALAGLVRQDPAVVAWAAVRDAPKVTLWLDAEAAEGLPV